MTSFVQLLPEEIERLEHYRKLKNTALLTILFTDIVGYTAFTESAGEAISGKLRRIHDELFVKIITEGEAGEIIKQIGDSFLAVFSEPSTAVQRALDFQAAMDANEEVLTYGEYILRARIGIHLGQVSMENAIQPDIFGRHVNRAARIMHLAKGGQIITSQVVWDNASGWLRESVANKVEWKTWGMAHLKGIAEPIGIYEFFYHDVGSRGIPEQLKQSRRNKHILDIAAISLGVVLVGIALFVSGTFDNIETLKNEQAETIDSAPSKTLFVANIVSRKEDIGNTLRWMYAIDSSNIPTENRISPLPDTLISRMNTALISTLIETLQPNRDVVTQKTLTKKTSRKSDVPPEIGREREFLRQYGLNEGVFTHIYQVEDSLARGYYLIHYTNVFPKGKAEYAIYVRDTDDLVTAIMREVKDDKLLGDSAELQGDVIAVEGESLLLSLSNKDVLSPGLIVSIERLHGPFNRVSDPGMTRQTLRKKSPDVVASGPDGSGAYKDESIVRIRGESHYEQLGVYAEIVSVSGDSARAKIIEKRSPWITVKPGDSWSLR